MPSRRQAWVLLLAACDASTDPLAGLEEPTPVGDNLRFYTDDSSDVCAGTLGYMQEYVRELIAVHGASPDHVVDYYWYPDDQDRVHDLCSSEGCTFPPGTVVSPSLPHEHELVHAVHGASGRAALFFEEGSAELFGSPEEREYDLRISVSDALEVSADPDSFHTGYYGVAERFSAFLSREYGRDAFVSLLTRTTYGDTVAEVDLALRAEFGRGLEDLAAEYEGAEWTCRRSSISPVRRKRAPTVEPRSSPPDESVATVVLAVASPSSGVKHEANASDSNGTAKEGGLSCHASRRAPRWAWPSTS